MTCAFNLPGIEKHTKKNILEEGEVILSKEKLTDKMEKWRFQETR